MSLQVDVSYTENVHFSDPLVHFFLNPWKEAAENFQVVSLVSPIMMHIWQIRAKVGHKG